MDKGFRVSCSCNSSAALNLGDKSVDLSSGGGGLILPGANIKQTALILFKLVHTGFPDRIMELVYTSSHQNLSASVLIGCVGI